MKKIITFLFVFAFLLAEAKTCTTSCTSIYNNADGSTTIVGTAYGWTQPDGTDCVRPLDGDVYYAVAIGGSGKKTIIIDQGVIPSYAIGC